MSADLDWLHVEQGSAPLLLSIPHAGTDLRGLEDRFVSPWLARKDADWHVPQLYSFARELGATTVWTDVSRSVIDVNRDPSGKSCAPALAQAVHSVCAASNFSFVLNGRFKGGFITRHFGQPEHRVHAIQMELAMRGYLRELPGDVSKADWPPPFEPMHAAPGQNVLRDILERCVSFARNQA